MSAVGMYSASARATVVHAGQHLQGCVTCYAVGDAAARGLRVPAIGDRVVMTATLLGEACDVEVIVTQVDVDPTSRRLRVIGRPEGTLTIALARTEWRELARQVTS